MAAWPTPNPFQGKDAILSGPAGGIVGAARTAGSAGFDRIIGFDMGGTSTDVRTVRQRVRARLRDGGRRRAHPRADDGDQHGRCRRADRCCISTARATASARTAPAPIPGPACYRRGGPLTVTGRQRPWSGKIQPAHFPAIFGPDGDETLDADAVRAKFAEFGGDPRAAAEGFLRIAVANMAKRHQAGLAAEGPTDASRFALQCFGGAGGQHACMVADELGMETVFIHPFAGVLSAYGMGLADQMVMREQAETVLCVCNLSRTAQAVELDLSAYIGRVPVDAVGGSIFPPIGQLTYLLTLPPYGFFWFLLAQEAELPTWHTPAPEPLPEFSTIVVRGGALEAVTGAVGRRILEGEALPAYIPKRRWFGAKGQAIDGVSIAYAVPLPGAPDVLIAEVETRQGDQTDRYVLPLGIAWDSDNTVPLAQQLALARIRHIRRVGFITDAFAVDEFAHAVVANLMASGRIALPQGELRFEPTSIAASIEMPEQPEIRRFSAEQSNSSLVIGDLVVIKIVRHVSPGIHPEGEMTRYLTEKGFGNTAGLVGEVLRIDPDGTPNTLLLVQNFVRNQGDAWTWTLDFLARAVDELAVTGQQDRSDGDLFATYTGFATALGQRLGELHAVLAQPSDNPDFHTRSRRCRDCRGMGRVRDRADRPGLRFAGGSPGLARRRVRDAGQDAARSA